MLRKLAFLSLIGLFAYLYVQYGRAKEQALKKLRAGSQVIELKVGALEVAREGQGTAILVLHGGGGGYEQGLSIGRVLSPNGEYTIIAPSRPGARRTPLSTGRTYAEQTRALCELLDQQQIEHAIIVGVSAGGMSTLQFAIDYPERCRALILISAVTPVSRTIHAPEIWVTILKTAMSSDFLLWLLINPALTGLLRVQGDNLAAFDEQNPMLEILKNAFPPTHWRDNVLNDLQQLLSLDDLPLEKIQAPTLMLHGMSDIIVPYEVAVQTAKRIPQAEFVSIEEGTHMMLGTHRHAIREHFERFMSAAR